MSSSHAPVTYSFKILLAAFAVYLVSSLLTVYTNHLISMQVTRTDFGDYSAALQAINLFAMFALFGGDLASLNFLSEYLSKGQWREAKGYILFFSKVFSISMGSIITLSFLAYLIKKIDPSIFFENYLFSSPMLDYLWLSPIVIGLYFMSKLLRVFSYQLSSQIILNIVVLTLQVIFLFMLMKESIVFTVENTVLTYILSNIFGLLIMIILLYKIFPGSVRVAPADYTHHRVWLSVAIEMSAANFFLGRVTAITLVLAKIFGHHGAFVGDFGVVWVLVCIMFLPASAAQLLYANDAKPLVVEKRYDDLQLMVNSFARFCAVLSVMFLVVFILFHKFILGYFAPDYYHIYKPTLFCFVCITISSILSPATVILMYGKGQRYLLELSMYSALYLLAVGIPLIYYFQLWGCCITFGSVILFIAFGPVWELKRNTGVVPYRFGMRAASHE